MDIAIIGAGSVGTALATSFTRAGHDVTLAARDPEHAAAAATTAGARHANDSLDAVRTADIVVLAVGYDSVPDVAAEIGDAVAGKTIIDVTNRFDFGENGLDMDTASSNAESIAARFPDASVVKAFNTLLASRQADPVVNDIRLDGFVAGDDPAAKAAVLDLVRSIGLDPIDVGPLARARQLESLAFLNMALNIANGGSWQSGWKLVNAPIAA